VYQPCLVSALQFEDFRVVKTAGKAGREMFHVRSLLPCDNGPIQVSSYFCVRPLVTFSLLELYNSDRQATWNETYSPILTQLVGKKSGDRYVELDLEPVMIAVIKLNSSESFILFAQYKLSCRTLLQC
jgi:hypothetical protein